MPPPRENRKILKKEKDPSQKVKKRGKREEDRRRKKKNLSIPMPCERCPKGRTRFGWQKMYEKKRTGEKNESMMSLKPWVLGRGGGGGRQTESTVPQPLGRREEGRK